MGHKTITISEEAYETLAGLKQKGESFTKAILRVARKEERGSLLEYIRSLEPDEEFAEIMGEVVREREKATLRVPRV